MKKSLEFSFSGNETAGIIASALAPELNSAHERHAKAGMHINKNILMLKINAADKKSIETCRKTYSTLIKFINNLIGG
ncbi:MAG: hypothetical protein HYW05_03085 [Candidatus Diapherotrites archaeon]|nr:hypothetical protein [Candidatus Diapherotrites archaeon]